MKCGSCGVTVGSERDWVEFRCPNCGKGKVVRCSRCKTLVNTYKCQDCRFTGP